MLTEVAMRGETSREALDAERRGGMAHRETLKGSEAQERMSRPMKRATTGGSRKTEKAGPKELTPGRNRVTR